MSQCCRLTYHCRDLAIGLVLFIDKFIHCAVSRHCVRPEEFKSRVGHRNICAFRPSQGLAAVGKWRDIVRSKTRLRTGETMEAPKKVLRDGTPLGWFWVPAIVARSSYRLTLKVSPWTKSLLSPRVRRRKMSSGTERSKTESDGTRLLWTSISGLMNLWVLF